MRLQICRELMRPEYSVTTSNRSSASLACHLFPLWLLLSTFVRVVRIGLYALFTLTCNRWETMVRTTTISPWVEIGLRFIGMWPNSAYPDLYWVSYIIFTVVLQYFQYAYVIVHFDAHNLPLLMDCLGLSIATTLSVLKLCALRWNRR